MVEQALSFGPYSLFRSQKMLKKGDEPLHLGGRAMTLLIALVDRAGEVVSKKELRNTLRQSLYVPVDSTRTLFQGSIQRDLSRPFSVGAELLAVA